MRRTTTAAGRALAELESAYVETFDTRRRRNLFLTYFAHGDTRKRGMALLRFRQTYLASGYELPPPSCPTTCASCWSTPPPIDGSGAGG